MENFEIFNVTDEYALALGFFDGVHIAHQKVISNAVTFARNNNIKSAVVTFKHHPKVIMDSVLPKYIMPREETYNIIKNLGIDSLIELDFDTVRGLTPEQYLKDMIEDVFHARYISTGFNHFFGYNKSGNPEFLRKNQKKYNYIYNELPGQKFENEIISSSAIRNYLSNGVIEKANKMLGRNFYITGKVIEGKKIGRTLGFPTANLEYPQDIITLPKGVYKVKIRMPDNNEFNGITNVGICPTVNKIGSLKIETHIFNFDKDIYNKVITIYFEKMIRKEIKFNNIDELRNQVQNDIKSIS